MAEAKGRRRMGRRRCRDQEPARIELNHIFGGYKFRFYGGFITGIIQNCVPPRTLVGWLFRLVWATDWMVVVVVAGASEYIILRLLLDSECARGCEWGQSIKCQNPYLTY